MSALVTALALLIAAPAERCEASLGMSGLLYWAAFSNDATLSLDVVVRVPVAPPLAVAGGLRLGFGTVRVDAFTRIELAPELGAWRPITGLELGVTSRGHYEDGGGIVGALARTSRRALVPVYTSLFAAPLRFALDDTWRLSFAELELGTHLDPAGRYVRVGLGFVTLGASL